MAKCDLCNKEAPVYSMAQLRDPYRIQGVTDICPDCEKWAGKAKSDLIDRIAPELRRQIKERKAYFGGERPKRLRPTNALMAAAYLIFAAAVLYTLVPY